jgi:phosphoribosylcarboxyaminoimidazole (NCAIR) mutase
LLAARILAIENEDLTEKLLKYMNQIVDNQSIHIWLDSQTIS